MSRTPHDREVVGRVASLSSSFSRSRAMAGFSKHSAPRTEAMGPVENQSGEIDDYTIDFMALSSDVDGAPLLQGLPDDRCQCPHWGYVLKGKVVYRFADHDETY